MTLTRVHHCGDVDTSHGLHFIEVMNAVVVHKWLLKHTILREREGERERGREEGEDGVTSLGASSLTK